MKIETKEVQLRKMTAKEGYVFKQAEAEGEDVYGDIIYLSVADAPENYIEIPKPEPKEGEDELPTNQPE